MGLGKVIATIIVVIMVLVLALGGWYIVQPGQVAFEKTFGKINNSVKTEGLYFKLPVITDAIKMNTRNIVVTTKETAASKDVQIVTTELSVNFSIESAKVIELYTTVGNEKVITSDIVLPAIQESIKAATAKFTATESVTEREKVRQLIIQNLEAKLKVKGLIINQVNVVNFSFSKEFDDAIESKVTAEQDALKSKALVEKVKYEAEAKIAQAKGDAESVRIAAIAEAEAIKIKTQAVQAQGGSDYIKLKYIEKWSGILPTTALGEGTNMFINLK